MELFFSYTREILLTAIISKTFNSFEMTKHLCPGYGFKLYSQPFARSHLLTSRWPLAAASVMAYESHSQPAWRSYLTTSRWPLPAAESLPWTLSHFMTTWWPAPAAEIMADDAHWQLFARSHLTTSRWPPLAAQVTAEEFHLRPFTLCHLTTSRWPAAPAARVRAYSLHCHQTELRYLIASRSPIQQSHSERLQLFFRTPWSRNHCWWLAFRTRILEILRL